MNILFVFASNKDRSPALENHFREKYPQHEYRSAGINKYHAEMKGTMLISEEDVVWADVLIGAKQTHIFLLPDPLSISSEARIMALNLGDYNKDNMQQYVLDVEKKILEAFPNVFKEKTFFEKEQERFVKKIQEEANVLLGEYDVWKLLEEMKKAPLELIDMSAPCCDTLRNASPQQLPEAAVRNYSKNNPEAAR